MGLSLTQERLFKMGRQTRDSLVDRTALDNSPMGFGKVVIFAVYEIKTAESDFKSYSLEFSTHDGKKFTYHKEYTCNLVLDSRGN